MADASTVYALAVQYWFVLAGAGVGGAIGAGYLLIRWRGAPSLGVSRPDVDLPSPNIDLPSLGIRRRIRERRSGGSSGDGDGSGFSPNWKVVGTVAGVAVVIALPLTIYYLQGAWPFGPWHGNTIFGLPLYWTLFFSMLLVSIFLLPLYVYFIAPSLPLLGGVTSRLTWIIAGWSQGATIFDRAADGRYYARPMRKNDDTGEAEMWVDGEWIDVPGNIEFVSRLAWRPVAFTWEKTDAAIEEIRATDMGEDPVDYLVERGMLDRDTAEAYQPHIPPRQHEQSQQAAADGGVQYDEYGAPIEGGEGGVSGRDAPVPYNILDYRGHAYQAFNPWPNGGSEDEYVVDTRKVMHKLSGAGETALIQRAKDIALTDTAKTGLTSQVVGWVMTFGALIGGVAVAYFTV